MYMTNEEWEQNNQDYLKESYEETGFTAGGYAVRKLICGGCGRVFYTTISGNGRCRNCALTTLRSSMPPLPRPLVGSIFTA